MKNPLECQRQGRQHYVFKYAENAPSVSTKRYATTDNYTLPFFYVVKGLNF